MILLGPFQLSLCCDSVNTHGSQAWFGGMLTCFVLMQGKIMAVGWRCCCGVIMSFCMMGDPKVLQGRDEGLCIAAGQLAV